MTKDKNEDFVEVQLISYDCNDEKYCKEEKTFKGDACMPRMINNICEYFPRTKNDFRFNQKIFRRIQKTFYLVR